MTPFSHCEPIGFRRGLFANLIPALLPHYGVMSLSGPWMIGDRMEVGWYRARLLSTGEVAVCWRGEGRRRDLQSTPHGRAYLDEKSSLGYEGATTRVCSLGERIGLLLKSGVRFQASAPLGGRLGIPNESIDDWRSCSINFGCLPLGISLIREPYGKNLKNAKESRNRGWGPHA